MKIPNNLILLLVYCLVSLPVLAVDTDGRGGGNGVLLVSEELPDYSDLFFDELRRKAGAYVMLLQYKQHRLPPMGSLPLQRLVKQSDAFIKDIAETAAYNVKDEKGACGFSDILDEHGEPIPLVASTALNSPSAEVCIDREQIKELEMTEAQLVGIAVHEACRHLEGCIDDDHALAKAVAESYKEVMKAPVVAKCNYTSWLFDAPLQLESFGQDTVIGQDTIDYDYSDSIQFETSRLLTSMDGYKEVGPKLSYRLNAKEGINVRTYFVSFSAEHNVRDTIVKINSVGHFPFKGDGFVRPSESRHLNDTEFEFSQTWTDSFSGSTTDSCKATYSPNRYPEPVRKALYSNGFIRGWDGYKKDIQLSVFACDDYGCVSMGL